MTETNGAPVAMRPTRTKCQCDGSAVTALTETVARHSEVLERLVTAVNTLGTQQQQIVTTVMSAFTSIQQSGGPLGLLKMLRRKDKGDSENGNDVEII